MAMTAAGRPAVGATCLSMAVVLAFGLGGCKSDEENLFDAIKSGDVARARSLLEKGTSVDCRTTGFEQNSPLHVAARSGNAEMVTLLIKHQADVNAQNRVRGTPLEYACSRGAMDVVKVLVEAGAVIDSYDGLRRTPFVGAVCGHHLDIAEYLLSKGADVNAKDFWGNTSLHYAATDGDAEAVELLIAYGADVNIENNEGHTALEWASEYLKDNKRYTARGWASDHVRVVEILKRHGARESGRKEKGIAPGSPGKEDVNGQARGTASQ